jgi:hypothetical protein
VHGCPTILLLGIVYQHLRVFQTAAREFQDWDLLCTWKHESTNQIRWAVYIILHEFCRATILLLGFDSLLLCSKIEPYTVGTAGATFPIPLTLRQFYTRFVIISFYWVISVISACIGITSHWWEQKCSMQIMHIIRYFQIAKQNI